MAAASSDTSRFYRDSAESGTDDGGDLWSAEQISKYEKITKLTARRSRNPSTEKLTQRRKGAKVKTDANVANSIRRSGQVIILNQRVS
jgi:hypothetical protein